MSAQYSRLHLTMRILAFSLLCLLSLTVSALNVARDSCPDDEETAKITGPLGKKFQKGMFDFFRHVE